MQEIKIFILMELNEDSLNPVIHGYFPIQLLDFFQLIKRENPNRNLVIEEIPMIDIHLFNNTELPYLYKLSSFECKYNSKFGDNRICECGHTYEKHFDTYEDMDAVGCKHCKCDEFKERFNE